MTKIRLHGILAAEYGDVIHMDIYNPRDIIKAIDCNRVGFRKRVVDLHRQGFNYDIVVDKKRLSKESFLSYKKPKELDLVPIIVGSGQVVAAIAIAVVSTLISYALMDPGTLDSGESTVSSKKGSLIFQGGAVNLTSQGTPIPIGYGRLRVGSQVIQSSIKSFPQSVESSKVMASNILTANPDTSVEIKSNKIEPS
jgi:predicted phage tail protein